MWDDNAMMKKNCTNLPEYKTIGNGRYYGWYTKDTKWSGRLNQSRGIKRSQIDGRITIIMRFRFRSNKSKIEANNTKVWKTWKRNYWQK